MTVQDFYDMIDGIAPFETQADFDNSGLLVGSSSQEVDCVLFALDVTEPVIEEAAAYGAQLIVTHHPLMFSPIRTLTDEDYEGRLIRQLTRCGISLIAAHTNLDRAKGGINDVLADLCGLTDVTGEGFFRCGRLEPSMTARAYAEQLSARLGDTVRLLGPKNARISKAGLCSGGGGDEWPAAAEAGCQAFISGEIKHHHALAMADRQIVGLECGHAATETPGIRALADALQNRINQLECKVRIYVSDISAYSFSRQP